MHRLRLGAPTDSWIKMPHRALRTNIRTHTHGMCAYTCGHKAHHQHWEHFSINCPKSFITHYLFKILLIKETSLRTLVLLHCKTHVAHGSTTCNMFELSAVRCCRSLSLVRVLTLTWCVVVVVAVAVTSWFRKKLLNFRPPVSRLSASFSILIRCSIATVRSSWRSSSSGGAFSARALCVCARALALFLHISGVSKAANNIEKNHKQSVKANRFN